MIAVVVALGASLIVASATTGGPLVADAADVADPVADDARVDETVVQGTRPAGQRVGSDDVQQGPASLLGIPGLALARDGGPLSSMRPLRRGLGGARLGVDVAGIGFADPLGGDVDAALLPLGLGMAVVGDGAAVDGPGAPGGQLSIRPAAGHRLQLVVGELSTLLGSGRVVVPVSAGRVIGAVDVGTTRGDFPFAALAANGSPVGALRREGNDQRRAAAAVVVDVAGPTPSLLPSGPPSGPPSGLPSGLPSSPVDGSRLRGHVVAAGSFHEGGVPGFATAPLSLRSETLRGALGGVVGWSRDNRRVEVGVEGIGNRRRTTVAGATDELVAVGVGTSLTGHDVVWQGDSGHVDVNLAGRAGMAAVAGAAERRDGAGSVAVAGVANVGHGLVVGAAAMGGLGVVIDVAADAAGGGADDSVKRQALLPRGQLKGHVADDDNAVVWSLALRHASRAPTLDERFAPAGFVVGTPGLLPERVTEVETRLALAAGVRHEVSVEAAAFASSLDDAIVMVNRNAFEVAPENTGPARRAGVELAVTARPWDLVLIEQAASVLWSEVEATGAPLPTAPPLSLRSRARLGTDDAFGAITVTGRGSAPSTIFGTLGSGAFVLVDLALRLPLAEALALTVAIDNALDVRTARDQNLLPLPGRLAFVGLEVRP